MSRTWPFFLTRPHLQVGVLAGSRLELTWIVPELNRKFIWKHSHGGWMHHIKARIEWFYTHLVNLYQPDSKHKFDLTHIFKLFCPTPSPLCAGKYATMCEKKRRKCWIQGIFPETFPASRLNRQSRLKWELGNVPFLCQNNKRSAKVHGPGPDKINASRWHRRLHMQMSTLLVSNHLNRSGNLVLHFLDIIAPPSS